MSGSGPVPSILSNFEQVALLKQPNIKAPTGLRNICIMLVMLKAGLRVSETLSLIQDQFDRYNGKITITESGGAKGRSLWLGESEVEMLNRWCQIKPQASLFLFTTLQGKQLSDRYIRDMVKRVARKAGIQKNVNPHMLRHTFASDLLKETGDIRLVQQALGHREISATRIYFRVLQNQSHSNSSSLRMLRRSGLPVVMDEQTQINYFNSAVRAVDSTIDLSLVEEVKLKTEEIMDKMAKNEAVQENEPDIVLDEKMIIPAMKCSQCDYILRYRENCPKCGQSFNEIIKHWGRNI